jgi:hypothetical protein
MATYGDRLRDRLKQIQGFSDDSTTWSQLKAAREKQKKASLADVANANLQTEAYKERLANYEKLGKGGYLTGTGPTKPKPPAKPAAAKPKSKKSTVVTRKHSGQINGKTLW